MIPPERMLTTINRDASYMVHHGSREQRRDLFCEFSIYVSREPEIRVCMEMTKAISIVICELSFAGVVSSRKITFLLQRGPFRDGWKRFFLDDRIEFCTRRNTLRFHSSKPNLRKRCRLVFLAVLLYTVGVHQETPDHSRRLLYCIAQESWGIS